ncbi:hypothetical protein BJY21_000735 [Kineosphaera limosa]|uniref:Uncharacterized protein n=1 Tax=Kineosphaera limosa NBRC 100340 TaxID=1184609 RepID=K6VHL2_9MICO|nr:hypothetical protein [Kineosphaera limosa]NYD99550.1 hypothetical protein [Kineosphaera limosa]GAB95693.1 hypothetical protein KILIM_025_00300 [Kineosphaera limosa NBRC 100340]
MDVMTALAEGLAREYPGLAIDLGRDRLSAQLPPDAQGLPDGLAITARREALEAMLAEQAEVLSRWWPDKDPEVALAGLLCVHVAETIATLRPGEYSMRLGELEDRPPPAPESGFTDGAAHAPRSGARYRGSRRRRG